MRIPLLWKLVAVNVTAIALVLFMVYMAIKHRAAYYFIALMETYDINPVTTHSMFLEAVYRALGGAALASLVVAVALNYLLARKLLKPLSRMTESTARIAAGDYRAKVEIDTADEIGRLGVAFNRMAEDLERIQELRKSMVIDVAHELRTPLTNIRGYLEAIRDGVVDPTEDVVETLHEETLRLVALVEDLLTLARADAARATLERQLLDLRELADGAMDLFAPRFREKSIEIERRGWSDTAVVHADPEKLSQVLRNLLQNAWQYTPEGGRVTLAVERAPAAVKLTVSNTGPGIPPEHMPFIFERFYRADRSRSRASGGAGIGLAIVKELVEAHGGQVGAESRAGEACIWFSVPA